MFSLLAPIVGAAGGIISNLVGSHSNSANNKTQLKIAADNRDWASQQRDLQNQWNLEQWNRENVYNAPASQKQRFQDAGINPYIAMSGSAGSMAAGNATPLQSAAPASAPNMPQTHAYVPNTDTLVNSLSNMFLTAAQTQKVKNEALGQGIDNQYKPQQYQLDFDYKNVLTSGVGLDNKGKVLANQLANDTLQDRIAQEHNLNMLQQAQVAAQNLDNDAKTILNSYLDRQQQSQLMLYASQINNLEADVDLKKSQVKVNNAQIQELIARKILDLSQSANQRAQAAYTTGALTQSTIADTGNKIADTYLKRTETRKAALDYNIAYQTAGSIIRATNMANISKYQSDLKDYHYNKLYDYDLDPKGARGMNTLNSFGSLAKDVFKAVPFVR